MGAWGEGPFDNDDAADFLDDLSEAEDPGAVLTEAMEPALGEGYLEAPDVSVAVAAASVVAARRRGVPVADAHAAEALASLTLTPDVAQVQAAHAVFERAFVPQDNEWFELWEEADGLDAVRAALEPLREAVRP